MSKLFSKEQVRAWLKDNNLKRRLMMLSGLSWARSRMFFRNYRYVNYSNGFILLERKEDYGIPQEVTLGTTEGKIGEVINIPEYKAGYLYGKINVKSTLYGKVLDLLYKPEQVNIRFIFKNGSSSPTYRLIPATAREGLFLSS